MARVEFRQSGVEGEWTNKHDSLLEFGEGLGLFLDFGCRVGNCTMCQQRLLSGEVTYPNGHSGQPDAGNILLCCSVPKGEVVIDA